MSSSPTATTWLTSQQRTAFRRRLLRWYTQHARELPWRTSRDPYRVWVSEVMLQQTTVATIRSRFPRFIEEFPTVASLAAASEEQVLRAWEGLGYYRRARGLHAAAKQIVAEHGGQLPDDVPTLMKLPGIGRYTAGAIVSIAFDKPAPVLEANTIRLFARLLGVRDDATTSAAQKQMWQVASELLPQADVARFNQALMELGSLVCTPREPDCPECPVSQWCGAYQSGDLAAIGATTKRVDYINVREAAIIIRKGAQVLVRQCAEGERWAGLWDFPRYAIDSEGPLFAADELRQRIAAQTGINCRIGGLITTLRHGVTRYRIVLDCYAATYESGRIRAARWVTGRELKTLPLSVTGRKLAEFGTEGNEGDKVE